MYKFHAALFVQMARSLGGLEGVTRNLTIDDSAFDDDSKDFSLKMLGALKKALLGTDLPVSSGFANIAMSGLEQDLPMKEIVSRFGQMQNAVQLELEAKKIFALTQVEAAYYQPESPLFGAEVENKFPGAVYEIEEAGKCYGLSRSTASVFHSIRSLEAAIRAVSRCLGIPDPTKGSERSWHNMLRAVKTEIDKRWPSAKDKMSGDGRFFEGIHAVLTAMQNPYRNSTMHLDEKYTLEEAIHIFEMVKGVMKKVASRMDEEGLPLA